VKHVTFFSPCPECAHERSAIAPAVNTDAAHLYKDVFGNVFVDCVAATVIKDLKIKGPSSVVKVGTGVRNIALVAGDHDIDGRIDGIGAMKLKRRIRKKRVMQTCTASRIAGCLY
jgi:protein PhnA